MKKIERRAKAKGMKYPRRNHFRLKDLSFKKKNPVKQVAINVNAIKKYTIGVNTICNIDANILYGTNRGA